MASVKLLDFWAPWCIDPQTPVLTENGYVAASKIQLGMNLVTIDPRTKKQALKKVRKVRIFEDVPSKKIVSETGRSLIGDVNHLVLTSEGFVPLGELSLGDKVLVHLPKEDHAFEINNNLTFLESKKIIFRQLTLGVHNDLVAQNLQIPANTIVSLGYIERRQKYLIWESVTFVEEVENRDVVGITVDEPHTIITNGLVSHNCGPCKVMAPVLEELKKELGDKAQIEEINVDEKPQEAQKYGVMSIPTYIVLKDDKEVGRRIGVTSKAELLKLLQS